MKVRVRVVKDFSSVGRSFRAGEIVTVNHQQADLWLRMGIVMLDKSLDGAKETK